MSWSLDVDKVDTGFTSPPVGRKRYKIVGLSLQVDKQDPTGKSQYALLKIENAKMTYTHSFYAMAEGDRGRIAQQDFAKVSKAAGISGVVKPERFKTFVGKEVELEFIASKKDPKYVNLRAAYPVTEEEEEPASEEQEEESEIEESQDQDEEGEPEEKPAAPAGKKPLPWKKK